MKPNALPRQSSHGALPGIPGPIRSPGGTARPASCMESPFAPALRTLVDSLQGCHVSSGVSHATASEAAAASRSGHDGWMGGAPAPGTNLRLERLPPEIIEHICNGLPLRDLVALSCACPTLRPEILHRLCKIPADHFAACALDAVARSNVALYQALMQLEAASRPADASGRPVARLNQCDPRVDGLPLLWIGLERRANTDMIRLLYAQHADPNMESCVPWTEEQLMPLRHIVGPEVTLYRPFTPLLGALVFEREDLLDLILDDPKCLPNLSAQTGVLLCEFESGFDSVRQQDLFERLCTSGKFDLNLHHGYESPVWTRLLALPRCFDLLTRLIHREVIDVNARGVSQAVYANLHTIDCMRMVEALLSAPALKPETLNASLPSLIRSAFMSGSTAPFRLALARGLDTSQRIMHSPIDAPPLQCTTTAQLCIHQLISTIEIEVASLRMADTSSTDRPSIRAQLLAMTRSCAARS